MLRPVASPVACTKSLLSKLPAENAEPASTTLDHAVSLQQGPCCEFMFPSGAAGGMIAAKQPIITYPTRTNQIPRHVPPPHWASHPYVLFAAAGLLPFGTIFVELYFAMTSIWQVRSSPSWPLTTACSGLQVLLTPAVLKLLLQPSCVCALHVACM